MVKQKQRNGGFSVFVVMFFLQLSALLSLYSLQDASHTLRRLQYLHADNQQMQAAKVYIHSLTRLIGIEQTECEQPVTLRRDYLRYPLAWWLQHGCHYQQANIEYYYVIERLGAKPCAVILNNENNQAVSADFYRITLNSYQMTEQHQNKIILQSTLAKAGVERLSCAHANQSHEVHAGLQATRILTGLRNIAWD